MISAQFAKILNDVWSSKSRSLLIILSIFVGLTAVGAVLNARTLLANSIDQAYAAARFADGLVVTAQPFDADFPHHLVGLEGVAAIDARRALNVQVRLPNGERNAITIFTVPDYNDLRVNLIVPQAGAWPPQPRALLIEAGALGLLQAQVGDNVAVELPGGVVRRLAIVGTVIDRAQPPAALVGTAYGYVDAKTMEWLSGGAGFNLLYFTIPTGQASPAEKQRALTQVVTRVEKAGYTVASSQTMDEIPINSIVQMLVYILAGVGGLSLFLSFFLIINTISALAAQQRRQIGIMKAVGGRAAQILWMYLLVVIFYGVIALALSIPLSIWGGAGLSRFILSTFDMPVVGARVQAAGLVVQIVIGLGGPALAALLPLSGSLRVSATQTLRDDGGAAKGSSRFDRLLSGRALWPARGVLLRPLVLAVRNMFRHKARLALTLITLALAGAVFTAIFNLRATIALALEQMTQMQSYDLTVSFHRAYRTDELRGAFGRFSQVQAVDALLAAGARRVRPGGSQSDPLVLSGVRLGSAVISPPRILAGRWLVTGDGPALVVTSTLLQKEPDLRVGQEVVLRIDDRDVTFRIVGTALTMGAGLDGGSAYTNFDYLARLVPGDEYATSMLVKLAPGTSAAGIEEALLASGYQVAAIQTTNELRTNTESNFTSVLILLLLMALLLALVGGMGLMGTMSINVIERTREIGVLRAIGASRRGVTSVFMIEGVCIGLLSCAFAIPLSYPVTDLAAGAIGALATGAGWESVYTAGGKFIWAVLVVAISLLANYVPARSAARLTVRETLAYE